MLKNVYVDFLIFLIVKKKKSHDKTLQSTGALWFILTYTSFLLQKLIIEM